MTRLEQIRAVLFDLDGTLIDSAPDLGFAVDLMRVKRGLDPLPLELYRPMAGAGARGMLGVAFGIKPDHHEFESMKLEFFDNYEACMTQRTVAFEGVQSLLNGLVERGYGWGVVTNKSERFALPLTAYMPEFSGAGAVVCGDTTPHAKPHPAPLLEAAKRLNLASHQCLYVGDDERDIQAGKAAGMLTVAATYGYLGQSSNVADWGGDYWVSTPLALLDLLNVRGD
jgi:N-acetyl-D-muramate 6-phosphate phosphatase